MEIGEIMRTHREHLKYALLSCRDGKFVSRCSRNVFVTVVPAHIDMHVHVCAVGRPKIQTPKFIATKHDTLKTRLGTRSRNCARYP